MHETVWDLREMKERREEMAREMEEIRLARHLRGNKGVLRCLVAGLFRDPRSRGSSPKGSREARGAGEGCKETSPTTLA